MHELRHAMAAIVATYRRQPVIFVAADETTTPVPGDGSPAEVRWVSPLVRRCCEIKGLDLDRVVELLRRDTWRSVLDRRIVPMTPMVAADGLDRRADDDPPHLAGHRVLAFRARDGDQVELRLRRGQVDVSLRTPRGRLWSHGRSASLFLLGAPHETILAALPGRLVEAFVSHPLLDGAGHVVKRTRSVSGTGVRVLLSTGRERWSGPSAAADGLEGGASAGPVSNMRSRC